MEKPARSLNPDIIRTAAAVLVFCNHFYLNSEFYTTPVEGARMLVMMMVRVPTMMCVPLFMLLTGYLTAGKNEPVTFKRAKKLGTVVGIYVIATLFILLFRRLVWQESIGPRTVLFNLLSYRQYSWYTEYYLTFFFLMPFLSLIWRNLPDKKQRGVLVLTLLCATALPSAVNCFNFADAAWWADMTVSDVYTPLIPDYLTELYPFTYFYLGAWLREYPLKLKQWHKAALLCLCFVLFGCYNYYRSRGVAFIWGSWMSWNSFENTICSVLFFSLLADLRSADWPKPVGAFFRFTAPLSYGAYLVSWIPDNWLYPKLIAAVPDVHLRFVYFPVMILAVTVVSFALSWLADLVYRGVCAAAKRLLPAPKTAA